MTHSQFETESPKTEPQQLDETKELPYHSIENQEYENID
jgi:hypothetical protein